MATRNQLLTAFEHEPTESAADTSLAATDEILLFGDGTIKTMLATDFYSLGAWATGVNISQSMTTAISVSGATTTGISLTGDATTAAIKIATGTVGIGLEMAGTHTGHMIYLHPAAALATNKRAFRIGDYGTEFPMVAGEGMIRTYGKITSGTSVTAIQFHWGIAESAAPIIGSQMQIESACATPGPTSLMVHDFIGGIQANKFIATGGDGFVGIRSKLYADVTSTCSGDVYNLWLDSQMSCAVAGTEASIKVTTGGSKPDAFVWFNTTSSGLSQLFYFDSTMAAAEPFMATGCSVTVATVPYLKVLVNATQYGIPLIAI